MNDSALRELADDPSSRKRFLKMMGGAGAASFAVFLAACGGDDEPEGGASGDTSSEPAETGDGGGTAGDLEIVNYALTLEFLEADFYRQVLESGMITDQATIDLATAIGESEQEHVDALTATAEQLGGPPAEAPMTDFEDVLAGGPEMILSTAAVVENLGAAAYLGAAGGIQSKEILAAALAIHSVEARHAAALNQAIMAGFQGDGPLVGTIPDGAFAMPMTMEEVLEQVQPFLAS